jgi:hypothetical protein
MNLPRIIGVTGYAQHGKDSLADMLVEHEGYKKVAFAAALKQMALVLNPIISGDGTDEGGLIVHVRLAPFVEANGWEAAKQLPEVRRFLQVLGTEAVRDILGTDSWLRALWNTMAVDPEQRYVISDVRFPNEEEFVHVRCDGMVFRVHRVNEDGTEYDNGLGTSHPSEMHVATLDVDADLVAADLDQLWQEFVKSVGA